MTVRILASTGLYTLARSAHLPLYKISTSIDSSDAADERLLSSSARPLRRVVAEW